MALYKIERQCSLFRSPGQPSDLADPTPTLRGWLEETSLEVQKEKSHTHDADAVAVKVLPRKIVLVTNEKHKFLKFKQLINYFILKHVNS